MKASALEFRFRYLLHTLVLGLGLFAPWNRLFQLDAAGPNAHTWGVLAAWLSEHGVMGVAAAFDALLLCGIFCAFAAAALRTWATAYLGSDVVDGSRMVAGVVASGPYRLLRNPLYVGTVLHTVALALLMPLPGAVFSIVVIVFMQARLILGEEAFLAAKLGPEYQAYCRLVPRVLPRLPPRVGPAAPQPHWGQAFLAEIYMWGVAVSYAVAGWQFNESLLIRCVLVSMGVALIVRAFRPADAAAEHA